VRRGARWVALVAVALGAAACGTVLGLDSYGNAPVDAGADGHVGAPFDGTSGEGSSSVSDSATPDSPVVHADAQPDDSDSATDASAELDQNADDGAAESGDAGTAGDSPFEAEASPVDGSAVDAMEAGYTPPAGWTLVAFADTPQTTCPAGFTTAPLDVVFDTTTATPLAAACTCGTCYLTAPPSCVTGSIAGGYDDNGAGTCSTTSTPLANANPGGCNTDEPKSTIGAVDYYWDPLPPTGGSCTSGAPTPNASRVTFGSQGRVCGADGDGGAPPVATPFLECILGAATANCPPGPLSVPHQVGTGATITCADSCTCAATATCLNPEVTYYVNGETGRSMPCTGGTTFVMAATGACASGNGGDVIYYSYRYSATVTNPTCTPTGAPAATVTGLASPQTICCAE
jgi:hypothetical protein